MRTWLSRFILVMGFSLHCYLSTCCEQFDKPNIRPKNCRRGSRQKSFHNTLIVQTLPCDLVHMLGTAVGLCFRWCSLRSAEEMDGNQWATLPLPLIFLSVKLNTSWYEAPTGQLCQTNGSVWICSMWYVEQSKSFNKYREEEEGKESGCSVVVVSCFRRKRV